MATKQCSKCNVMFGCAAPVRGCWCEQYSVSDENLAEMRGAYKDCLCPQCLADYAENTPDNNTRHTIENSD